MQAARSHLTQAAAPDGTPGTAGRSICAARFNPFQIWAERPTGTNSPA